MGKDNTRGLVAFRAEKKERKRKQGKKKEKKRILTEARPKMGSRSVRAIEHGFG